MLFGFLLLQNFARADFWQEACALEDIEEQKAFIEKGVRETYPFKVGMSLSAKKPLKMSGARTGLIADPNEERIGEDIYCFFETTSYVDPKAPVRSENYRIDRVEPAWSVGSEDSFVGVRVSLSLLSQANPNEAILDSVVCGKTASFGEMEDFPSIYLGSFSLEELESMIRETIILE